ncbi:YusU family protein [Paenibacillus andongensis]|uniref:YusU family protein n=1 Tax=Paenibacillus andongensis TaxID=2975482 RepID=UPI0021BBB0C9|nr:YusU family protein [Paenibacillus andongensis]
MNTDFENEFNSLVFKTAELITGDTSPEMLEKIKIWAFFNHVHKSLPALTSHWNQTHPEGKAEVRRIFEEIRELNQTLQAAKKPEQT